MIHLSNACTLLTYLVPGTYQYKVSTIVFVTWWVFTFPPLDPRQSFFGCVVYCPQSKKQAPQHHFDGVTDRSNDYLLVPKDARILVYTRYLPVQVATSTVRSDERSNGTNSGTVLLKSMVRVGMPGTQELFQVSTAVDIRTKIACVLLYWLRETDARRVREILIGRYLQSRRRFCGGRADGF